LRVINATQFRAILRIFHCFLFRNYSVIAHNEIAQAEATIARNFAQRNSDWKPYVFVKNSDFSTQFRRPLLFQTLNSAPSNNMSLKFQRCAPPGCKDRDYKF